MIAIFNRQRDKSRLFIKSLRSIRIERLSPKINTDIHCDLSIMEINYRLRGRLSAISDTEMQARRTRGVTYLYILQETEKASASALMRFLSYVKPYFLFFVSFCFDFLDFRLRDKHRKLLFLIGRRGAPQSRQC